MPITRKQTIIAEGKTKPTEKMKAKKKRSTSQRKVEKYRVDTGIAENDTKEDTQQRYKIDDKANLELSEKQMDGEGPASKKLKMEVTEETKSVYYKVGQYRNINWYACC